MVYGDSIGRDLDLKVAVVDGVPADAAASSSGSGAGARGGIGSGRCHGAGARTSGKALLEGRAIAITIAGISCGSRFISRRRSGGTLTITMIGIGADYGTTGTGTPRDSLGKFPTTTG